MLIVSSLILMGGYLYFESYQRQSEITTELLVVERSLNAVNNVQTEIQKMIRDKRAYQFGGSPTFLNNVNESKEIVVDQVAAIDDTFPAIVGINTYDDWVTSVDELVSFVDSQISFIDSLGIEGARSLLLGQDNMMIRLNMLKERETATLAERDRLEFVLEGTKAGLWEWNVQTGETVFDERWASLIGYRLEDLLPVNIETWVHFTHPEDLELARQRLDACFSGETELYECEFRMKHKEGHWVWILDRGSVKTWTDDGKPLMMFGTHIDVSEAKHNAIALAEKERMYRGIFNSSFQFMALLDPEGNVREMNESGIQFSGHLPSDIKGKPLWECSCWMYLANLKQFSSVRNRSMTKQVCLSPSL